MEQLSSPRMRREAEAVWLGLAAMTGPLVVLPAYGDRLTNPLEIAVLAVDAVFIARAVRGFRKIYRATARTNEQKEQTPQL